MPPPTPDRKTLPLFSIPSRHLAAGVLMLALAGGALAQEPVEVRLGLAGREHHEIEVQVTFPNAPEPLEVRMSRSSPGRYALHEFAKNVYRVTAVDGAGRGLELTRVSPYQWDVQGHGAGGTVVFRYTLFGDSTDGTYAGIDRTHAHLNTPATLAWARGLGQRPVRVRVDLPDGWRVSTQLRDAGDGVTFEAPDLDYLMDSPIEISDHRVYSWTVPGPNGAEDRPQTVRLALHDSAGEQAAAVFVELAKAVVAEEIAIFGEPPAFDFGVYTFLADYLPWASGDGMEHRNSTVLTTRRSIAAGARRNLGTVAHEFFHAWNIERLRPRSLEPFDFERANMSAELWFGEGFTSYYDDLVQRRARVISFERWVDGISDLLGFVLGSPATSFGGPAEMSRLAPFVDAARSVDPTNRGNTFLSYYSYGAALALALDLELRTRFDATLDDLMALLWRRSGRGEQPYTNADLERALGEVAGDAAWARSFFAASVYSGQLPDYGPLLAAAGLELRRAAPYAAWLGLAGAEFQEAGVELTAATVLDGPLYRAGIDRGDVITAIDGSEIVSRDGLDGVLERLEPGQTVAVKLAGRGPKRTVQVELVADPRLEVRSYESAGRPLTEAIETLRDAWLAPRSDHVLTVIKTCPEDGHSFPFEYEHCPWDGVALDETPPGDAGAMH